MHYLVTLAGLACVCTAGAAEPFELRDGDRVVLLGSTLIEREQQYGYWETALTVQFPERNMIFRNLGWSGDTVWGDARAGFDTPAEGFRRLVEHTLALKPTVIMLGYGTNESFAGEAGLPAFRRQFDKLLDGLAPSKARLVLLAPPMFEDKRWPAGHLAERKRALQRYTESIREIARQRQVAFADEFCQRYGPASLLTDNGLHLTAYGYQRTAGTLANELHIPVRGPRLVEIDGLNPKQVLQQVLPGPFVPPHEGGDWDAKDLVISERYRLWLKTKRIKGGDFATDCQVIAHNLAPGRYTLKIDGRAVQTEDAKTWMDPPAFNAVSVLRGPSLEQTEKLRQAIVEKNRLYFYRWRPQNETYLFGFRKHEQGQNAREVPLFDPLVAEKEAEIAKLRVPVQHRYELVREGKP